MAKSHLIPFPIVDRNGKITTVRRKAAAAPLTTSKLAGATPVRPDDTKVTGTPLPVVYPLSRGEIEEFLAFYTPCSEASDGAFGSSDPVVIAPQNMRGTERVFLSLSGVSQGLLWRVRQSKAMSDSNITVALSRMREKSEFIWDDSRDARPVAEAMFRSVLLVAERVHVDHPELIQQHRIGYVQRALEDAIGGHFSRGMNTICETRELSTVEEVSAVAGVAAYLMVVNADGDPKKHTRACDFWDEYKHEHHGMKIANPTLADYVEANPEQAVRAAKFVVERGLGHSKRDAQFVIDHLNSDTPALSEGEL